MSSRRSRRRAAAAAPSPVCDPDAESPLIGSCSPKKNAGDLSDLRSWMNDSLENLRADSEQMESEILKELEGGSARFKKRMKTELESSTRQMEEANRAWKSFAADVEEDIQDVQSTCKEFIAKAQAGAAKSCCGELLKSFENQLEGLCNKYVH